MYVGKDLCGSLVSRAAPVSRGLNGPSVSSMDDTIGETVVDHSLYSVIVVKTSGLRGGWRLFPLERNILFLSFRFLLLSL